MPETKKPKPKALSDEAKANIVEEYLGIHPKYFIYEAQQIKVDIWKMEHDGVLWRGWTPHLNELGGL